MSEHPRPETIALHGGQEPDSATIARAVPICRARVLAPLTEEERLQFRAILAKLAFDDVRTA